MVRALFMVVTLSLCWLSLAHAEEQSPLPPRHRVAYSSLLVARINPLGLEEQITLGYQRRLYQSAEILWRDCFIGLDFTPVLNPAMVQLGAQLTIQPIALLLLSARYSFTSWFGTFEYLQSYASPHQDYSDTALDGGKERGENYRANGGQLQLQAQVQGKAGPIVLRNDLKLYREDMDLRGDDTLYYNATLDALLPNGGWALTNDTDLVYLTQFGLVAGIRHTLMHAFYRDSDFRPGESTENPNTPHLRVGPLLAYVLYDRPDRWLNKPTLLLIVSWYLSHRWRTGADVSQALPYAVLGFRFSGDLWSRR